MGRSRATRAKLAPGPKSLSVCHQLTGALDQVGDAGSALGVAVGDGRRRRCAECVCVERQRLQRLQQPERRSLRRRLRRLLRDRIVTELRASATVMRGIGAA